MRSFKQLLLQHLPIFLFYVIIAIISTYPLIHHFSNGYLNTIGRSDATQYIWNLWWMRKAFETHQNPFYPDFIYYPTGVGIVYNAFTPLRGLISIPFQYMFGLFATHNILTLGNLVFLGFAMYLAVYAMSKNKYAAVVAGLFIMLSPYVTGKVEVHQNFSELQYMPLLVLFIYFLSRSPSLVWALSVSLCLVVIFFTDYYQFFLTGIFSVCAYVFLETKASFRRFLALSWVVALIVVCPFFYIYWRDISVYKYFSIIDPSAYSLNPSYFLLPTDRLTFYTLFLKGTSILKYQNGEELFLGWFALGVVVSQLYKITKSRLLYFLIGTLIISILFSLGPLFFVNSQRYLNIVLPFAFLTHIPVIQNLRAPIRFMILILPLFTILFAFSYARLTKEWSTGARRLFCLVSCLVIMAEFISIPRKVDVPHISSFFYQIKRDTEDFAIWTVPMEFWEDQAFGALAQTIHEKRTLGGFVSRPPEVIFQYYTLLPIIGDILNNQFEPDIIQQYSKDEINKKRNEGAQYFIAHHIRYAIFFKNYPRSVYKNPKLNELFLLFYPEQKPFYEDDQLIAYKLY